MTGLASLLCAGLLAVPASAADVYISLAGSSAGQALPLGLPPFTANDPGSVQDAAMAQQTREVIRADLMFSRYFRIVEDGPTPDGGQVSAVSREWKLRGAGWILTAKAAAPGAGSAAPKVSLTVSLTDLNSGEQVFDRYYQQDAQFWRSLAHRVSDDLVKALTGKIGIAHSQLAFANRQTGNKEIYLADYDGANLRRLTNHRAISLLPRLSPDRKTVAYTSYRDGNPDLFLLDLATGKSRVLSNEQGLNVAGGFSPDGNQMLMTLSRQKHPNIYVKGIADGSITRLTNHTGVDTSPTFSPDASQVAFVSDRSGNPQVYILDMTTQRAKKLTRMNWCDSPSWSPTGEWIAFAGRSRPKDPIDIFLVDVTGNQVRQLTHGEGSNEDPSWSPDGRFLTFVTTRGGRPEVYVMDADGSAPHRLLDAPGASSTPDWSR
ncbi:MAG: Tol-Pal system beta propeller repeat protein TolB [Elusimicrobia bacterium]|nr:Tol-Pal system beta propeller repeat protein TolB [Elusimicrobiota bacterium]